MPLEQAEKCRLCPFMSYNFASKDKEKPNCCDWDKYRTCQNYFKYFDIYPLEIEEHNIEDLHEHDKELVAKVLEKIKDKSELITKDVFSDGVMAQRISCYEIEQEILDQIQKECENE